MISAGTLELAELGATLKETFPDFNPLLPGLPCSIN